MLIFIPSFRKEVINASKSIARLAIHCHEQQDFVDLQTITVCIDIESGGHSDDSDFSMSSATGYAKSNVSGSRNVN